MRRSSILTIVLGLAAVLAAALLVRGGDGGGGSSTSARKGSSVPSGALALRIVTSPEKQKLLEAAVARFNESGAQAGGRPVVGQVEAMNSGDAELALVRGRLRADVWTPASSFWGRLANLQADRELTPAQAPSLVRTPLVVAMWEPMARALGWPRKPVGFADITRLAKDPRGWAAAGKPAFGAFKYVHTNPDSSTSGAEAVAASYFAVTGKREGLTEADVRRAAPEVKQLERSIVHYGSDTLFIADQLCRGGLAYASAVAMEETTLLEFNRRQTCNTTGQKLVAVYPKEGSFYSDSPLYTLATGARAEAAKQLLAFLARDVDAEAAGRFGFRPGDEAAKPAGLVASAEGVDPAQPRRVLEVPTAAVLNRVLTTWRADRKPARVQLVLDNSGSMNDEDKLVRAKEGLQGFFRELAPQDEVGLTKFSTKVVPLVAPAPFRINKERLRVAIVDIVPENDTAVRDATVQEVERIKKLADADHINAVVVLTDGEDTASSLTESQVVERLRAEGDAESRQVRVFTIAYGSQPNARELQRYADASGGKAFRASTDDIEQVYRSISSFF
jgi:Ca-activated chloride channel family protein